MWISTHILMIQGWLCQYLFKLCLDYCLFVSSGGLFLRLKKKKTARNAMFELDKSEQHVKAAHSRDKLPPAANL